MAATVLPALTPTPADTIMATDTAPPSFGHKVSSNDSKSPPFTFASHNPFAYHNAGLDSHLNDEKNFDLSCCLGNSMDKDNANITPQSTRHVTTNMSFFCNFMLVALSNMAKSQV